MIYHVFNFINLYVSFLFLTGPILLDTCSLSPEAARATQTDIEMIEQLEVLANLPSTKDHRETLHSRILNAKSDISTLTPNDLILKDLKFVNGIPIPGFPILIKVIQFTYFLWGQFLYIRQRVADTIFES